MNWRQFLNPQSAVFLVTVALLGLLTSGIGAELVVYHPHWASFMQVLGATIIGSALSMLVSRVFEPSQVAQIQQMLSTSRTSSLVVDDALVEPFRQVWHGYLLSQSHMKPVWRYRIFDFTRARTPGHLHAVVNVVVPPKGLTQFIYDGFVADKHLILVGRERAGGEHPTIHVFPHARAPDNRLLVGAVFVETFERGQLLSATILSRDRLIAKDEIGEADAAQCAALNQIWRDAFFPTNQVTLPQPLSTVA